MGYDIELRNVSDFLASSYDNEKTREVYLGHLKEYFNCLYPELASLWNRSVSRKLDPEEKERLKKEYWRKLDVYSLLYVQDGERN